MSRRGAVVCSLCRVPPGRMMSDAFKTLLANANSTHQENRMTSQLTYLISQQTQAELVHTHAPYPTPGAVDPKELDDQVDGIDDRSLAADDLRPAPGHSRP